MMMMRLEGDWGDSSVTVAADWTWTLKKWNDRQIESEKCCLFEKESENEVTRPWPDEDERNGWMRSDAGREMWTSVRRKGRGGQHEPQLCAEKKKRKKKAKMMMMMKMTWKQEKYRKQRSQVSQSKERIEPGPKKRWTEFVCDWWTKSNRPEQA